ncbi:MAG: hypothetical protein ACE5ID_02885, partial [Acidobacteriota bacterium]
MTRVLPAILLLGSMGVLEAAAAVPPREDPAGEGPTVLFDARAVRSALWPGSTKASYGEGRPPAGDGAGAPGQGLSLAQLHDVEEWLRQGPDLPDPQPAAAMETDRVVTLEVHLPGDISIPVLVRPPSHDQARRQWPMLLAMHGGPVGDDGEALAAARRMIKVWAQAAERHGWLVAAPAMTMTVAAGPYTPQRLPYEIFHPEEAEAVIQAVRSRFSINPDRIVSTGISLGSNFSIAFAAANPDRFAAIVPVSTEGDSREELLRNLAGVPAYILEGSQDRNIRKISGPRAMSSILDGFGDDLVYREFPDRSHEGFQEHYDDVLNWLDSRPRRPYPRTVLRVPHQGIMPLSRRLYWVESDTRQGLIKAEIQARHRVEIAARRVRRIT